MSDKQYVSPKTQMITHFGKQFRMVAGEPYTLPEGLIAPALAKGVREYDAESSAEEPVDTEAPAGIEDVIGAIKALMESGDPKAFSERTGEPSLVALRKQLGRQVTDAERDAAWASVKAEE